MFRPLGRADSIGHGGSADSISYWLGRFLYSISFVGFIFCAVLLLLEPLFVAHDSILCLRLVKTSCVDVLMAHPNSALGVALIFSNGIFIAILFVPCPR